MSVYTLKTLHCLKWFNFTSQLTCPWLFSINTCQFIFVYELKTDPTKNNIPVMQTLTLKIKKRGSVQVDKPKINHQCCLP